MGKEKDSESNVEEKKEGELKTFVPVSYTQEELEHRHRLITAMCTARDQREMPHAEFDDMTYSQYYDTNKRADMSYIPAKKNKYDKRIVTGYTREKDNTLLSALLAYNFQPDITVYDDTEMVVPNLGNHMEDIVKKTRELEGWNKMRPLIYRELISQGSVFVEEIWQCTYIPEYDNKQGWKPGDKIADAKFEESLKPRKMEKATIKLHQGKNVYLGNFFEDDYNKQDIVFTYELIPRGVAKSLYGTWDRWENVPYEVDNTILTPDTGITYMDWNLTRTSKDYVGVLKIQEKFSNSYMIMLNGVMMLPVDFPLSEISPDGEYTIKMRTLEGINGCAYGKGQPSKTKVDQAVHDEFLRLMILREEQASTPPMGYKGKRVLSSNIYYPGKINNNMREGDLFPILPKETGLNSADFSMYQLIKTAIDDKTINATFSGQDQGRGSVTATQILQEKQQQLLKLGLNFDAVKELEKELIWARIGNIIMNYAKPIGTMPNMETKQIEDMYRSFSLETTLSDGKQGIKTFTFTNKEFPSIKDQLAEEKQLSDYYGKPVNSVYLNSKEFSKLLKYRWIVNIIPTQEDSDQIERQLYVENIKEAQVIFGPQSLNYEYIKEEWALKVKTDPSRFFLQDGGQGIMAMLGASAGVGQQNEMNNNQKPVGSSGMTIKPPSLQPVK